MQQSIPKWLHLQMRKTAKEKEEKYQSETYTEL
jgi:hypothetical protein